MKDSVAYAQFFTWGGGLKMNYNIIFIMTSLIISGV